TGKQYSVREFVERAAAVLGMTFEWRGQGESEVGVLTAATGERKALDGRVGEVVVEVDPRYFRPTEVETLLGDASKAREKLGWTARATFQELVEEMALADLREAKFESQVK